MESDIDSFLPSPPLAFWVALSLLSLCPCCLMQFSLLAPPAAVGWGPFCSGRDLSFGSSVSCKSLTSADQEAFEFKLVYLSIDVTGALVSHPPNGMVFWLAILCTCVSVHRRDRCTRTFLFHYFGPALLFRVHASPPCAMIQNCNTPFTKVKRTALFITSWSVPPSVPLVVLWSP